MKGLQKDIFDVLCVCLLVFVFVFVFVCVRYWCLVAKIIRGDV